MLEWATDYFEQQGISNARHSIEWLLADTLEVKRLDLYLLFERPLSPAELEELRPLVKRRARHEPLQHITGYSEFMNARINVDPSVLVPRMETEQLVEIILDDHPADRSINVLDIGTGSGCIPIALKMERPAWNLTGIDISDEALAMSKKNACLNDVDIQFKSGDIKKPEQLNLPSFDLIISNPPYITPDEKETLEREVKDYEPALALYCGDVEKMYRHIAAFAAHHLTENGSLYLEINARLNEQIISCFDDGPWHASLLKDYAQKPRFIRGFLQN